MRRYGSACYMARPKKPYAYGSSSVSTKEIGSGSANPGLMPPTAPEIAQGNDDCTTLSNVNGTQFQVPKYKYKYKYPKLGDKKRNRKDEGLEDMHMQQKALPGEQYRGGAAMRVPPYKKARKEGDPPGIEPRSVPGDQYEEGASINTEKDKAREEGIEPNVLENLQQMDEYANISSQLAVAIKMANYLGQQSFVPAQYRTLFKNIEHVTDSVSSATWLASTVAPTMYNMQLAAERLYPEIKDKLTGQALANWNKFTSAVGFVSEEANKSISSDVPGKVAVPPKGMGGKPGESVVPGTNATGIDAGISVAERDTANEGEEPMQAYGGEVQKAQTGGDPNRTDPITPATGSRQTPATANSIVSIKQLKAAAERTSRQQGPEAVHGNARERANMGKGALDTYEFQGPFDYPIYPGGRPDDTLTMMGAWRTDGGNDSSLWYSKKTAKGANAKRNKYFKWTAKGGGKWRKLSKDDMVNVIQKGGQSDNRFYGTRTNLKFAEFQRRRDRNVALGKIGNARTVSSEHGTFSQGHDKYVGTNKYGVARKEQVPSTKKNGNTTQGPTQFPSEVLTGFHNDVAGDDDVDEFGDVFGQNGPPGGGGGGGGGGGAGGFINGALNYAGAAAAVLPAIAMQGMNLGGVGNGQQAIGHQPII